MSECLTGCPKCGACDGRILMPYSEQGFCDTCRTVWEVRRRTPDGTENAPANAGALWRAKKYHRVGPAAKDLPTAQQTARPIVPVRHSFQSAAPRRAADKRRLPWRRIKTLNLIYHIWPVASNGLWKWNVEQLRKRLSIFNGSRTVVIAVDEETVHPDEVRAAFAGDQVDFIEVPNNARLREATSFLRLLKTVFTHDKSQATFYAHAKGVSRAPNVHLVEKAWAECMYHYCLDFPDRVRDALSRKAMYGVSFTIEKTWIYPGTFWWFHNATLFDKPGWDSLGNPITKEGDGWSVEALPNRFFTVEECERVYPRELSYPANSQFGLYDPKLWCADVRVPSLNERAKWRWGHANEKEWLTWGKILPGDNVLASVGRHAKLAGSRILEIGPGYGRFIKALRDRRVRYARYACIDLSPQRTRELRALYADARTAVVWGDCESFKDMQALGEFDLIVSTLVFKRLCPSLQLAATVSRFSLRPGGKLIFDVPETGVDWPATEDSQIGAFEEGWGFGAFSKSYRQEELKELLDAAGFKEVRFDCIVHDDDKRRLLVIATR